MGHKNIFTFAEAVEEGKGCIKDEGPKGKETN
jgi:hypothetical protein